MLNSVHCVSRKLCRVLGPAMLGGLIQMHSAAAAPMQVSALSDAAPALGSRVDSAGIPLHVLVGRSIFITTPTRLKRVFVSDPVIIDSFTSSPTQIVVTAKAPGLSSLILWDEMGQSQVYVVSSDTDTSNLQTQLDTALPRDNIRVETQQDRISLTGMVSSDAAADQAGKLAALYGKVVNSLVVRLQHPRQVKLKVQMIEIDRSKVDTFGLNFLSQGKNTSTTGTGQFPAVTANASSSSTSGAATAPSLSVSSPLNLLYYSSSLNVGLILQDLQTKNLAQILAEPTITTISGQKASFLSGGEFPFPVVQTSSGLASVTIQFRAYGVKLDFTPIVNEDGTIQLKVSPEVSALDYSNAVTISGYTVPAISTRRAETQVELRDGETFAISGLLDHRTTDLFNKMPGFGDIPILGQLFRSKSTTHSTVELMVLVTPTLVDPLTDATVPVPPKLPVPMLDPKLFDPTIPSTKPDAPPKPGGKQ